MNQKLLQEFVSESLQHMDGAESDLLALEGQPDDKDSETINRLFRAFHSIKGSAGLVGLQATRDLSHAVESVLMRLRQGEITASPEIIDVLLAACDKLRQLISLAPEGKELPCEQEMGQLKSLLGWKELEQPTLAATRSRQTPRPGPVREVDKPPSDLSGDLRSLAVDSPAAEAEELLPVLIVEDNKVAACLLKERILAEEMFAPVVAHSLEQAKEVLAAQKPAFFAAVLDLNLPDAPNGEVVDQVLAQGVPSIIMTATFDEKVREAILAKDIVDYVVKGNAADLDTVAGLLRRLSMNRQVTVLVVDDSATYRQHLRSMLELHHYQVVEAYDGQHGLEMVNQRPEISLVVTDYNMPNMDGVELVSRLRSLRSKDNLAIIGMSAEGSGALSALFLKSGANDFLSKPYLTEEFHCRVSQNVELLELIQCIEEVSRRDFLTGLFNRRHLYEQGELLHQQAQEGSLRLAVGIMDVDFFKKINDSYGHLAGDYVLQHIAKVLGEVFPEPDLVARWGGEEFCVLATRVDEQRALVLFNEARKRVERSVMEQQGQSFGVTVSVGLTTTLGQSLDEMVNKADSLLYLAKEAGRNRVMMDWPR